MLTFNCSSRETWSVLISNCCDLGTYLQIILHPLCTKLWWWHGNNSVLQGLKTSRIWQPQNGIYLKGFKPVFTSGVLSNYAECSTLCTLMSSYHSKLTLSALRKLSYEHTSLPAFNGKLTLQVRRHLPWANIYIYIARIHCGHMQRVMSDPLPLSQNGISIHAWWRWFSHTYKYA